MVFFNCETFSPRWSFSGYKTVYFFLNFDLFIFKTVFLCIALEPVSERAL